MQADKKWEDSVGKRLYDFEGEPSPQSWDKINQRIQPKRKPRWWLWLPALLLFIALPLTFYFNSDNLLTQKENKNLAKNESVYRGTDGNKKLEKDALVPKDGIVHKSDKEAVISYSE